MDTFNAQEWAALSKAERLAHCCDVAKEVESHARLADSDVRAVYERLAAQWRDLANEIDRHGQHF